MNKLYEKLQNRFDKKLEKEFLPEALEIIEKPGSFTGHLIIWVIFAVLISVVLWAVFGKVDKTVNVRGVFLTTGGLNKVQSSISGKISEILVQEGEHVKKGQVIMRLDPLLELKQYETIDKKLELLKWKKTILEKLLADESLPEEFEEDIDKNDFLEYMNLFIEGYDIESEKIERELEEKEISLKELEEIVKLSLEEKKNLDNEYKEKKKLYEEESMEEESLSILKLQAERLEEEETDYWELYLADAVTKNEWEEKKEELEQKRAAVKLQEKKVETEQNEEQLNLKQYEEQIEKKEKECRTAKYNLKKGKKEIEKKQNEFESLKNKKYQELSTMLVDNNSNIQDKELEFEKGSWQLSGCEILAPCDGAVQELAVNTIGQIVESSQLVASVLPLDTEIIFEADLPNKEKGFIEIGQEAGIKADAYNYQQYGKLAGRIEYISADAFLDEKKGYVYKIKIKTDISEFLSDNPEVMLASGMEGTLEIKAGERRIIEFFFEPLFESIEGSLNLK